MNAYKIRRILIVVSLLVPTLLFGFDFPGYTTYHGKIIDADTLKPIEGAVVSAVWMKCHPGLGHGPSCDVYMAKEALTDADGEWKITGPTGTNDPGIIRSLLGVLVSWNSPPKLVYYKPGYYTPSVTQGGGFVAGPYVNKEEDKEGIVLWRRGNTKEEVDRFFEKYDGKFPFIPIKDPEKKLRELDFNFKYPPDTQVISISKYKNSLKKPTYDVLGIKRAATQEEKKKSKAYGSNGLFPGAHQPLLNKAVYY